MVLEWWEFGVLAAIFAGTLSIFALGGGMWARNRVQKWIAGALGTFMRNLSEQASEEEGASPNSASPSAFKLGGFPVGEIVKLISDPNIQQLIGKFIKPGGGGGGGW